MLAKILSVGGWTLVSRVTGFARDLVMAAILGAGPIADAFVVAFRLPNHFRAIFGEGAFNSAFVPTYGSLRQQAGDMAAMLFANRIMALMIAVQALILAAAMIWMPSFVGILAPGLLAVPGLARVEAAFLRGRLAGIVPDDAGEIHAEEGGNQQDGDGADATADAAAGDAEAAPAETAAPEAATLAAPVLDILAFGAIEPHLSLLVP